MPLLRWQQYCHYCYYSFAFAALFIGFAVDAYLSPVYDIHSDILQLFNCPNNTPLHYIDSNYTSDYIRSTVQLKCSDIASNISFTTCGETVLLPSSTYVCDESCFISGVTISNRTISNFLCGRPIDDYYQLINCSWSSYYKDLLNSSTNCASYLQSVVWLTLQKKYLLLISLCKLSHNICNTSAAEIDIDEFHAERVGEGVWEFSCRNGYKLIGPDMYDCYDENISSYNLQNNCEDCCEPVHIANIETSCTSDNLTKINCKIGRILTGALDSAYSNTFCSSFLKKHYDSSQFYCEECNNIIELCNSCVRSNQDKISCTNCSHPDGYPVLVSKNQKKCKIIAVVKSLTVSRTIHNWTVLCETAGSPKVITSLYINGIERNSVKQRRTSIISEPIMPLNYSPKEAKCVASNSWGSDTRTVTLSIKSISLDHDQVFTPFPGARFIMNCVLKGDVDKWNWTMNEMLIAPGHSDYNLLPNTSLEIKNVSQRHQGMYTCSAWNPIEVRAITKTLYYTKPEKGWVSGGESPVIIEWVDMYQTSVGSSVVFQCVVLGSPMPVIAWLRNEHFLLVTGVMKGHEICNETTIHLNNITLEDEGYYYCIVRNVVGKDSKKVYLSVIQQSSTTTTSHIHYSLVSSIATASMTLLTKTTSSCSFDTTPTSLTGTTPTSLTGTTPTSLTGTTPTSISGTTPTSLSGTTLTLSDYMTLNPTVDSRISPSCVLLEHILFIFIILLISSLLLCILKLTKRKLNFYN